MLNYQAFSAFVQGGSHKDKDKPCEDWAAHYNDPQGRFCLAVICDGHSDSSCFRSERGSRLGCRAVTEEMAAWFEKAVEIGDGPWTRVENAGDLRRGDIVCFDTLDDWDQSDHVGIYLGDDQVLHASYGKQKVIISTMGYFGDTFSWGLRPIRHFDLEAMICALKPND